MIADAGSSLTARLVRALGGQEHDDAARPTAGVDLRGSRAADALARLGSALSGPLAVAAAPIDRLGGALTARPALLIAALVVLPPALRFAGPTGSALATVVLALAALAALLSFAGRLHADGDARSVVRLLLLGVALRVLVGGAVHLAGGFPDEHGIYHPLAADTAACWARGGPSLLPEHMVVAGRAVYFHLLSAVYLLVGPQLVAGRVLGALIGLTTAVVGGEIARAIGGRRAGLWALGILALHPEHALWNTTLSRDSLSTLLVLVALAALARNPGRLLGLNALRVAVPLALLTQNSFLVAGLLGATLAAVALAESISAAGRSVRGVVLPAIGVATALAALVFVGSRYGAYFSARMVSDVRSLAVGNAADFLPGLVLENGLEVALLLPVGALFVLFAPFPWTAVHVTRAGYGGTALAGAAITVLGLVGLVRAARSRPARVAPLVLFVLLTLCLLALVEGNSGIVVRHRMPVTAILSIGCGLLLAGARMPLAGRAAA